MTEKVHMNLKRLAFPLPSASGMFPILSTGSTVGNSTFMSSSSCAGGRPDLKQILAHVSQGRCHDILRLLFVQEISNPEYPFALFDLD